MATFDATTNEYTLVRGDCLPINITYTDSEEVPIDLTGKGCIVAFCSDNSADPLVEWERNDGDVDGPVLGGVAGTIVATVPHTTTKLATVGKKKARFQVILTDEPDGVGCRTTILYGYVNIVESAAELTED